MNSTPHEALLSTLENSFSYWVDIFEKQEDSHMHASIGNHTYIDTSVIGNTRHKYFISSQ